MGEYKKYWIAVVAVLIIGFSILGYLGTDVYHQAPPVPTAYVSQDGQVLFTKDDILWSIGLAIYRWSICRDRTRSWRISGARTGLIGCTKKCP